MYSFNHKDKIGLALFCTYVAAFNFSLRGQTLPAAVTLGSMLATLYFKPQYALYIPSAILSLFTRAPPVLDLSLFPNHALIKNNAAAIKLELSQMMRKTNGGNTLTLARDTYSGTNRTIGSDVKRTNGGRETGWRLLNIKLGGEISERGASFFPTLARIVEPLDEVKSCIISVLEPHIHIPPHVGYYKGLLRYMYPLSIPADWHKVFLLLDGKKYHWKNDTGMLWDDCFEHSVYNNTDETRVVIYMDIVRPYTNSVVRWLNDGFIYLATGSSIVQQEIARDEIHEKID